MLICINGQHLDVNPDTTRIPINITDSFSIINDKSNQLFGIKRGCRITESFKIDPCKKTVKITIEVIKDRIIKKESNIMDFKDLCINVDDAPNVFLCDLYKLADRVLLPILFQLN